MRTLRSIALVAALSIAVTPAVALGDDGPLICVTQGPVTVGPVGPTPDVRQCFL